MEAKEIEIPVPWGIIAAKTRGNVSNSLVLLLHGLLDNAGSFDRLVPMLPLEYYYVSVDLPGHGKSSSLQPLGLTLQSMDYIYVVKLLADHFARKTFTIVGHSFGAMIGLHYAIIYPESVERVITLDTVYFEVVAPKDFGLWTRAKFEECQKISRRERSNRDVKVTYQQALDMVLNLRFPNCSLTNDAAAVLVKRSIVDCGDGLYKFKRDPRIKNYMWYPAEWRYAMELYKAAKASFKVTCILTRHTNEAIEKEVPGFMKDIERVWDVRFVEGNHYVHLNEPRVAADIINDLLDDFAKAWGADTDPVVLLLHGLQDNAGSFDYLVPALPQFYYYVSVDLPGHGRSSHVPSMGITLQGADYVYVVKMLTDHFGRDKYTIIGHSFGAILGFQFGLVYPEKLDKVFVLDTLWFEIVPAAEFSAWTRSKFDEFVKINEQIRRNVYLRVTRKQALSLISDWRYTNCELTEQSAQALLDRSIVECPDGMYKFTRDLRLKNYMCYPVDEAYAAEVLKTHPITFEVVTILTKFNENIYNERYPKLVEAFKGIGEWYIVEGNHHVHSNNPEIVSPIINKFLDV